MTLNTVLDWVENHQFITSVVILPVVGAIISWLGKPRTQEDFAKMPYLLAQALRVWSAIFPDPKKAYQIFVEVLTRRVPVLPPAGTPTSTAKSDKAEPATKTEEGKTDSK